MQLIKGINLMPTQATPPLFCSWTNKKIYAAPYSVKKTAKTIRIIVPKFKSKCHLKLLTTFHRQPKFFYSNDKSQGK